jgi:FkbM family methyltransferase
MVRVKKRNLITTRLLKCLVSRLGFVIVRTDHVENRIEQTKHDLFSAINRWNSKAVPTEVAGYILSNMEKSQSQLQQDLIAKYIRENVTGAVTKNSTVGFFVEFGAADGIELSNSYILERDFGWDGIVSEPARIWHSALERNRNCRIDQRCVSGISGKIETFRETDDPKLSTLDSFHAGDANSENRKRGYKNYKVTTVSLIDLLSFHGAPRWIDFLSIDTEGGELEILRQMDFKKYLFGFIAVEHAYGSDRTLIQELLSKNGYTRILSEISEFDDWYLPNDNLNRWKSLYA